MRGTFAFSADGARRISSRHLADHASVGSNVSGDFGKPSRMGRVTTFVTAIVDNRAWAREVGITRGYLRRW